MTKQDNNVFEELSKILIEKNQFKVLVKCSFCGAETSNQPIGDGCHICLKGYMQPIKQ